ncbi:MAG: zf-HC2 domain-containing protein [candidate division KSB1 bacterium]|nr:zf-HC2 domain-containing protein [candidate division KSB1 bacterium]MDZ7367809.1 zf-HC2 domain-containing protein [candidate division KSB1 bacterium]MDZ7404863.1 zf-HC2 domain-containing protein [candidate division KSB1 bacterium]
MSEPVNSGSHVDEASLWQWRDGDLSAAQRADVQNHFEHCAWCRQRAEEIEALFQNMRTMHHAVQPTLAEQMRLRRALEKQFTFEDIPNVLTDASRQLVRWLAPAVAILAALFVFWRQETNQTTDAVISLLPETPESQLLLADSDEQLQQAMWELALNLDETQR